MGFFLVVLGVVLVIEGIPWFLSPSEVKKLLRQIMAMSDSALRFTGLVFMVLGLLLVYFGRG